jgi:hypothetical protein
VFNHAGNVAYFRLLLDDARLERCLAGFPNGLPSGKKTSFYNSAGTAPRQAPPTSSTMFDTALSGVGREGKKVVSRKEEKKKEKKKRTAVAS